MKHVVAILVKEGKPIAIGSNYHENCRREGMATGEGYDLCIRCQPAHHAEAQCINQVLRNMDSDSALTYLMYTKMYVYGHTYACESCKELAEDYCVEIIITGKEFTL